MTEDEFAREAPEAGGEMPSGAIDARVGNVSGGQIAVGNRVIQISAEHGSVVVAGDEQPLVVTARPTPVLRGLRPPRSLIGRDTELTRIRDFLEQGISVEVAGALGVGRTTILSAVSEDVLPAAAPQGIVAVPAGLPVDDVLQFVFDACFERSQRVKPTPEELRRYLRDLRILVILDDQDLDRQHTERILAALPSAVFVMGVTEPMLIGGNETVTLNGLDRDEAVDLLETALGRPMNPDERTAAGRLAEGLHGMPLQLLQLGAVVRDRGLSLNTVADDIAPTVEDPQAELQAAATEGLGVRERAVLVGLAAFGGVAVGTGLVAHYASEPDSGTILRRLVGRGLARGDDLSGWSPVELAVADEDDRARAAPVLVDWITDEDRQPDEVADEAPVVLSVIHQEQSAGRHEQVARIAAATEGMLALAGHWGTWRQVLEAGLGAANAAGDTASAAFFQHQLDVRAGTLQPITAAQEHLAQALREPDTLYQTGPQHQTQPQYQTEPQHTRQLYRDDDTTGRERHVEPSGGGRGPLVVGIGLAVVALIGLLIFLTGSNGGESDAANPGETATPGETVPKDGNGSNKDTPTPDVAVFVQSGRLVDGTGIATVGVQNSGGVSDGGVLSIAVEGGIISQPCGDGTSSEVRCAIDELPAGDGQAFDVSFRTDSPSVTVAAAFEPNGDDEDRGNNSTAIRVDDTGGGGEVTPDPGTTDGTETVPTEPADTGPTDTSPVPETADIQ